MSVIHTETVPVWAQSEWPNDSRKAVFNFELESANGSPVRTGQYACGSTWVAPASGDTGVKLIALTGNAANTGGDADILKLTANPETWSHSFGTGVYGNYDASKDEIANLPKTWSPTAGDCDSLVACMVKPVGRAIPVNEGGVQISGTDISAQASDNSINSTSTDLSVFAVNGFLQVSGFTGTASNNDFARITSVTSTKITLATGGADGYMLTDEAAGDTVSLKKACKGGGTSATVAESLDAFCVITILPDAPSDGVSGADSIRPPILNVTKGFLTFSDLDLAEHLPSLANVPTNTAQDYLDAAERMRHASEVFASWSADGAGGWTKYSEGGRGMRALLVQDDYGAGGPVEYGEMLLSTNSAAEKKPLVAAVVAYGMDLYHQHYSQNPPSLPAGRYPGLWGSGAGQSSGSSTAAYFAVALLNDTFTSEKAAMQRIVYENWDADDIHRGPDEIRHNMRGTTGVLLWGNGHERRRVASTAIPLETVGRYWGELKARNAYDGAINPYSDGGQKTAADPHGYVDGPPGSPGGYMDTTYGPTRTFGVLTVLMPEFGRLVNTTDPFEYADRLTRHGKWSQPDPVYVPSLVDQSDFDCTPYSGSPVCTDYRTGWGPSSADWRQAIEGTPGDSLVGRFSASHGIKYVDWTSYSIFGYSWAEILDIYSGPTYQNRRVPLGFVPAPDIYTYPDGGSRYALFRCGLDDATIHYTLDGSEPTTGDATATALTPVLITPGATVKAIAVKTSYEDSGVTTMVDGDMTSYVVTKNALDTIDMTNPPNSQSTNAALSSLKSDQNALNTSGGGGATINTADLAVHTYTEAFAVIYANQVALNTQIGDAASISAPSGTFTQHMQTLFENNQAIATAT